MAPKKKVDELKKLIEKYMLRSSQGKLETKSLGRQRDKNDV